MRNSLNFAVFVLVAALAAACTTSTSDSGPAGETITIIHELDTVQVKHNPTRVVALDYTSLEDLELLGIPVLGIPKSHVPSHLAAFKEDPAVEDLGTLQEVNFEKVAALNPDVIFMSERLVNSYPELKKIAPTVYLKTDTKDFVGSFKKISGYFAQIFDKDEQINEELAKVDEKIKAVQEKIAHSEDKGLITMFNNGKFSVYGKGSRFGIIHEVFGVKPAVTDIDATATHGQAVSSEFIQQVNPDILFVMDRGAVVAGKAADKRDIENALVQKTNAYKNGKVIYLNPERWYISGIGIPTVNAMIDEISLRF